MSFRPFGELLTTSPSDVSKYLLFSLVILLQALGVAQACYLFLRVAYINNRGNKMQERLAIACGVTLLGVAISLIDVEYSIFVLPKGQTNWSITLWYIGFATSVLLFLPISMVHKDSKYVENMNMPLTIVSVVMAVVGFGLTAVFWFHPKPIFEVRLTSFIWQAVMLVVISGITLFRGMANFSQGDSGARIILTIVSLAVVVSFNSVESPFPLLMRMFEVIGFTGVGFAAFWTFRNYIGNEKTSFLDIGMAVPSASSVDTRFF